VWQGLTDDDAHAELMVLTTCRVWHLATEGRFCSKAEAGRWALERDVTLRAVEGALFRRDGDAASAIEPTEIARLLGLVRAEIAATR
jgi:hypothetical protein